MAILHRPDTRDIPVPSLAEIFPEKYMDSSVFSLAKEEANIVPVGSRVSNNNYYTTWLLMESSARIISRAYVWKRVCVCETLICDMVSCN